jgi:hypothetical protein
MHSGGSGTVRGEPSVLGRTNRSAADALKRLDDFEGARVKIDVVPVQPKQFSSAET